MVQPTATQAENDQAVQGHTVLNKVADGSPLDPYTQPWLQPAPVNNSLPVITGANPPVVGTNLSCSTGAWSFAASYAYQWLRTGTPIAGATNSTYTTVTADKTFAMSCRVTATNTKGSTPATSAATALVP
jgi:hypothetical protein